MLRCLTEKEAVELGAPRRPGIPPSPEPAAQTPAPVALDVTLGPVKAEKGEFPEAIQSLGKANSRYIECVEKNGGLSKDSGKVDVKFLVRGRGRAEGASVKKAAGMTDTAAKCIADVVDRRFVGYPESEMVGAVITITVRKKSQ